MDWDEYFLRMVYLVASKSKDFRTKIGSVIVKDKLVLTTGFNGICRGVYDPADNPQHEELQGRAIKPLKYEFYEHSERNAIYSAARHGINIFGATIYSQGISCTSCTRAIIQSGLKEIIIHKNWPLNGISSFVGASNDWRDGLKYSLEMFQEAGIKIRCVYKKLGIKGFLDGKEVDV